MDLEETIEKLKDMRQALHRTGSSYKLLDSAIKHLETIPDLQDRLINLVKIKEGD